MGGAVGSNGRPRFAVFVDAQLGELVGVGATGHLQASKFAMLFNKKALFTAKSQVYTWVAW